MRHELAPIREEPEDRAGEDEWIIVAAGTVINSDSAEKRLANDTTKKAWKVPCFKTEPFKAYKVLQSCMFGLRKGSYHSGSPTH